MISKKVMFTILILGLFVILLLSGLFNNRPFFAPDFDANITISNQPPVIIIVLILVALIILIVINLARPKKKKTIPANPAKNTTD